MTGCGLPSSVKICRILKTAILSSSHPQDNIIKGEYTASQKKTRKKSREMRHLLTQHSHLLIPAVAITAIAVIHLLQSQQSSGFYSSFYWPAFVSSSSRAPVDHGAIIPLLPPPPPTTCTHQNCSSSPPLSRAEEKKQRAMAKLHNAVDQVLTWRERNVKDERLEKIELGLARARVWIREAIQSGNTSSAHEDVDYVPQGIVYKNAFAFHRSYLLMEKMFKIFVYEEGEPPIFHNGPCRNIYSMEGIFINFMEKDSYFRTRDPEEAHVFFLPFSVVMILQHLFDPVIRDKAVLERTVVDYVRIISNKYPYWNRSLGVDHFMLSCHDWGPRATWYHPLLYFHSIRVLCNANTSEYFNPTKDASIPEINLQTGEITGLTGGLPPSERTILGFFAGGLHGRIRPALLKHWKEKDKDLQVYEKLPEGLSYHDMMKRSKYCICPSGFEVASPRIVEAIYAECVPVLISQHYILPFSDVLNWDSFSVQVLVSEIPNLKKILTHIPQDKYLEMQQGISEPFFHAILALLAPHETVQPLYAVYASVVTMAVRLVTSKSV
ncbi:hypothetical protein Ancab_010765 [Ancistrocladus abbreviatus]